MDAVHVIIAIFAALLAYVLAKLIRSLPRCPRCGRRRCLEYKFGLMRNYVENVPKEEIGPYEFYECRKCGARLHYNGRALFDATEEEWEEFCGPADGDHAAGP